MLDLAVQGHVGSAESIDRLLRVADQEQLAWHGMRLSPFGYVSIVCREQQQDLDLERIGVLKLINKEVREAALEFGTHHGVTAHQVARADQKVVEVQRAHPLLG